MPDYWNYTDYVHLDNLESIEQALTQIFKQESCHRIPKPPQLLPDKELLYAPWEAAHKLWIVSLFVGASQWTIIETWPNDLLCRRANGATRSRLSELAVRTGSDAIHFSVYNTYFSILLEADASGHTWVSGEVDCEESEKGQFYDEVINELGCPRFHLINVPESMKAAMSEIEPELPVGEISENMPAWELSIHKSDAMRREEALWKLLCGERSYPFSRKIVHQVYTKQLELQADEARLLYFQPSAFYYQLHLKELFPKY